MLPKLSPLDRLAHQAEQLYSLPAVALEVLRRGMDQPPTITVPQGQTFNVFLNGDLVFDGPYERVW